MKYISLFLILLSSSVSLAIGYDPEASNKPNRHVFSCVVDDQIYSPAQFFNNNLRYRTDPHINNITLVIGDGETSRRIIVHTAPFVNRAANMWNQRLIENGSPTRLTEVGSSEEANFRISMANNRQQAALGRDIAQTTFVLPDEILSHYDIDPDFSISGMVLSNEIPFTEARFSSIQSAFSDTMLEQEVANMIVYQSISHEFGHALGLLHPCDASERCNNFYRREHPIDTQRRHVYAMAITAQLLSEQPDATVPLMTSDDDYFVSLSSQLNRRLEESDIGPSALELSAIEMENACSSSSHSSRYKRDAVFSKGCTEKPIIFYPVAQSLISFIETLLY